MQTETRVLDEKGDQRQVQYYRLWIPTTHECERRRKEAKDQINATDYAEQQHKHRLECWRSKEVSTVLQTMKSHYTSGDESDREER